jgi:vanillate O-demethylase ferredoxin subunit
MAFWRRIMASPYSAQAQLHFDDGPSHQKLDLAAVLSEPRIGTHVYVCGPSGFIESVFNTARNNGWNNEQLHCEFFSN